MHVERHQVSYLVSSILPEKYQKMLADLNKTISLTRPSLGTLLCLQLLQTLTTLDQDYARLMLSTGRDSLYNQNNIKYVVTSSNYWLVQQYK